jgi:integrase
VPYLYSDADIAALFAQAGRLQTPLRQETVKTLIGLMAVTGIRGGEALALDDEDFDPGRGLLLVRHAKLGRHRLLPLHPTTVTAVQAYRQLRDRHFPRPHSQALLVSSTGTRLIRRKIGPTFASLARQAGLASRSGNCRPRPHDLRHSFAVATLLDWCRDGGDVAARMPLLSAYLGHCDPRHTYWYLTGTPELLAETARRLGLSPLPGDPR